MKSHLWKILMPSFDPVIQLPSPTLKRCMEKKKRKKSTTSIHKEITTNTLPSCGVLGSIVLKVYLEVVSVAVGFYFPIFFPSIPKL